MRCADFYEKWKRDPNWCQKSPDAVRQIDHYLGLVAELETHGAEPAAIYKKFPEAVAREVLKIKEEEIKETVLHNAAGMIKRGEKVSKSDILVWAGIEKPSPQKSGKPTIVGSSTSGADVKTPKEKPIRCMYLSRDETRCNAGTEYQQKCTEEIRENRNCPINLPDPGEVPEPRTLADKMHDTSGMSDTCAEDSIPGEQNNTQQIPRTSLLQPPNPDIQKFEITARRYARVALRQYVHHKLAEDEQQAAQMVFDKGIEVILDEVEKKCMADGEE